MCGRSIPAGLLLPKPPGGPFVRDLWPASYGGEEGMSETYAGRQVMVRTWVAKDPGQGGLMGIGQDPW